MAHRPLPKLPIITLAKNSVLLPGAVLRIPVLPSRTDIRALLSDIRRLDEVNIVCVPLSSPYLTKTGQNTIEDVKQIDINSQKKRLDVNPATVTPDDIFGYGVAAQIRGVEGRGTGEFALLVEGISRVSIDKIISVKPYMEAEVTYQYDDSK